MRSITHHRLIFIAVITVLVATIPTSTVGIRTQPRAEVTDPAAAAVFFSQLEAEGRFSELHSYLHPDAQAIVPEATVVGWYRDNFAPLGPGIITVTSVQVVSWTWGVTGMSYPQTAQVSFNPSRMDRS